MNQGFLGSALRAFWGVCLRGGGHVQVSLVSLYYRVSCRPLLVE